MILHKIESSSLDGAGGGELLSVTAVLSEHERRVDLLDDVYCKTHTLSEDHDDSFGDDCAYCGEPDNDHTMEELKECQSGVDYKDFFEVNYENS